MACKNQIKYQLLEPKYLDSLIECIIDEETQEGSFLSNMRVDQKKLEQIFYDFLREFDQKIYSRVLIGIDTSNDKVIACVVGEDLKDVLEEVEEKQEDKVMEQYCAIQKLVFKEMNETYSNFGDIMVVDSYGVKKEYQDSKIGQVILSNYLDYVQTIGYKAITGVCTSRSCIHICRKLGGKVVKSVTPQQLSEIDSCLTPMFKENIEIPLVPVRTLQTI